MDAVWADLIDSALKEYTTVLNFLDSKILKYQPVDVLNVHEIKPRLSLFQRDEKSTDRKKSEISRVK